MLRRLYHFFECASSNQLRSSNNYYDHLTVHKSPGNSSQIQSYQPLHSRMNSGYKSADVGEYLPNPALLHSVSTHLIVCLHRLIVNSGGMFIKTSLHYFLIPVYLFFVFDAYVQASQRTASNHAFSSIKFGTKPSSRLFPDKMVGTM